MSISVRGLALRPFWETRMAKAVIAVEPDPACVEILNKLCVNCSNLSVIHGALASMTQFVGQSSVFAKIDIEGFEFNLSEEFKERQKHHLLRLQLAVHPRLYERDQRGNLHSRRLRTMISTKKLGHIFRELFAQPTVAGYSSLLSYVVFGALLTLKPKSADFVIERKLPPPLTTS